MSHTAKRHTCVIGCMDIRNGITWSCPSACPTLCDSLT
ncbi:hypothetical protein F383_29156 [Gossypium arboreum]|uniref:Uncharacterized protein n=1 Tax=Gossypium arboreum TaxID=29729 RepID=A0A0B0MND1_GOSAR|nr:hypothetical protein F383_21113 [Gossypium arboreum]KHG04524.1 hypothetical protein F383_29156 [Gossypium arboreum]